MEKMRPPGVTELLLTNDGDHILEGSITNFFVVCRRVSLMLGFGFLGIQTKLLVPCYWILPAETTEKQNRIIKGQTKITVAIRSAISMIIMHK